MKDDELLAAIDAGWRTAPLGERRQAMLTYVEKLTSTPAKMQRADVEALRAAGFSDLDVLQIAECASYYAYANRLADGLGIELEP